MFPRKYIKEIHKIPNNFYWTSVREQYCIPIKKYT